MKRMTITIATLALVTSLGLVATPSANAINCNAFNQGTAKAFHDKAAKGMGLLKIADACHMMP